MRSLKLVSIYTNPNKLVSTLATSSPAAIKSSHHLPSPSSLALNAHVADKLRAAAAAAKMSTCNSSTNLGLRGCKSLSPSSCVAKSYSSDDRGGGVSSSASPPSTSGGLLGRDSADKDWDCAQIDGSHQQQRSLQEDQSDGEQPSKLLTLPTILTIARVAAVPLLVNTFYMDSWLGTTATTGVFIFASITDWLDGYLARKMKLSSQFGAFLDPVADKLMVATTLILLCTKPRGLDTFGQVPWLLTVPATAIIGREITMSAIREWAASQDRKLLEAVAVNNLGKWKTATQMTALTILLATRDSSLVGAGGVVATGVVLLYISAWLAVWSLFVYLSKISKVLLR